MKNIKFENKTAPFSVQVAKSLSPILHFHKDIEIVYVINGDAVACADHKKDIIRSGDIFVSFPNQIHYYEEAEVGQYLLVIFSPDILFDLKDVMYDHIPKTNVLYHVDSREFTALLCGALTPQGEYAQTMIAGMLNQAMAMLLAEFQLTSRIKTNNTTLQEVLRYCSSNFTQDMTLDDVAEALHISKFHVSHLFSQKLGIAFTTYLNELRVNYACDLLEDTDKKITDIGEDAGFGSLRSFNRAFSNVMKMSPKTYRAQFQAGKDKK